MSGSTNLAAERIAASFNQYFADFNVRLAPADVVVGRRETIVEQPSDRHPRPSWSVQYCIDDGDDGQPCLEFYATSRWTNDRHARITADGRGEHLEALDDVFAFDPKGPNTAHAAREEFDRHNREIAEALRLRGFRL